ncbi:MAG TPA: APC family permease [Flexivirga sp.]|uniref:APC family permease n=1 Tax=Flexivirga sp. TaxID=1962927 RepID=UPI002C35AE72|nr:APC family permease [Flexivirga sp.]HWC21705.1 APC family permease [Flexivirga sp.]
MDGSAPLRQSSNRLRREVTLPQAIGVSFHQIVGGGVIALMGTAIGLTGAGTPLAFVLAAIAVAIYSLPLALLGSAMPVTGGRYAYAARLLSPTAGFVTMWFSIAVVIQLSLMSLAGAQYLHAWAHLLPVRPVAVALMTVFLVTNLFGSSLSGRVGLWLGAVMLLAFGAFIVAGVPKVSWSALHDVTPHGATGLFTASAMLTFAVTGSSYVAELGGEMKRPGRDVPVSMLGGIGIALVLYLLMAIPAVGILPIGDVAGKPMTVVAEHLFTSPWMTFFVLGGALVSVVGHINSLLMTSTKPLLAAAEDGWFPARLGAVNARFGTPHWLLLLLYLVGVAPVVLGFSVASIAGMVSVAATPMMAVIAVASLRLRTVEPEREASAPFRLGRRVHIVVVLLSLGILGEQAYLLVKDLAAPAIWGLAGWTALGLVIILVRRRSSTSEHAADLHPTTKAMAS